MFYDFKCKKCGKDLEVQIRLKDFDIEREKLLCCGVRMERDYKPTAIKTSSSPNRY
jgi:hypothetical protein